MHKVYKNILIDHDVEYIETKGEVSKSYCLKIVKRIASINPSKVIFLDYKPCSSHFLHFFDLYPKLLKSEIIIHLYGDFTLNSPSWSQCSEALKRHKVKIICASKEQSEFVARMILNGKDVVSWVPFPIDTDFFKVSTEKNEALKKKHKISEEDFLFLYTGRISRQKNVLELIELFNKFKSSFNLKSKLIIAGPFDNIGVSYLGRHYVSESYSYKFNELVSKNDDIIYIGNLSQKELKSYYNLSDCYVSLAAHNDEDFGMAPAEAACCGLPLLLSDWGGFKSFLAMFRLFSGSVPIVENDGRMKPLENISQKRMFEFSAKNIKKEKVNEIERLAHSNLSISKITEDLGQLFKNKSEKFIGFTEDFFALANLIRDRADKPFLSDSYSPFYHKIYKSYLSAREKLNDN